MSELGFVYSCIQKYCNYRINIVPLRQPNTKFPFESDIVFRDRALVLFHSHDNITNIQLIDSILDSNIRIPWGDLFVPDNFLISNNDGTYTTQFDVWGYWLDSINPTRFQEIMNEVYTHFSNDGTALIARLANTSFIKVFAKFAFTNNYFKTITTDNHKCFWGLCEAVISSSSVLSENVFSSFVNYVSRIPISITPDTFCSFLHQNKESMKAQLPHFNLVYANFSESLKIGFIKFLSQSKWPIRVFINTDLTLTALSKTLISDKTYNNDKIKSACIARGTIDEYIELFNNRIIKSIAYSCVRDAIALERNNKLSVLQKFVNHGFKESDAIIAIAPIGNLQLLRSFKNWAFNERILKKIPEDSWDSIQNLQLSSNDSVLPILRRLLFWEQVRTLSQPDSIIEGLNLDFKLKKTIQSLGGNINKNSNWQFFYEENLEELFYSIIEKSYETRCFHEVISNYPLFGEHLKKVIKKYCKRNPKQVFDESTLNAILSEYELYNDNDLTQHLFNYISTDFNVPLQLLRYYPSFPTNWKERYFDVIRKNKYSPDQLISSNFITVVGEDGYFREKYPKGFNPREDISDGTLDGLIALFNSQIIKDHNFILSFACASDNLGDALISLNWDNNHVRELLLASNNHNKLLIDFEKKVLSSPLNKREVSQFNSFKLYDEWLIELVTIGRTEAFLIDLIKQRVNNGNITLSTLVSKCQINDKLFTLMCKHPDFGRNLELTKLSETYCYASRSNKALMIRCIKEHVEYNKLLKALEIDSSGNKIFRNKLQHEAIRGLISSIRGNGIECFFHFTDGQNYNSIMERGLISYREIQDSGITCVTGGDEGSINIDRKKGGDNYVHLSFCKDTAMGYARLKNAISKTQLCFRIKLDILYLLMKDQDFVKFTTTNAATRGVNLLNLSDFNIDYNACKTKLYDCTDDQKQNRQAEILVKNVPKEYIENITNPLRNKEIYN